MTEERGSRSATGVEPGETAGNGDGDGTSSSDGPPAATSPETVAASGATPIETGLRVQKPWGHELIWAVTERYVGKVIVIETGRRLSLQRHAEKDESILVVGGRLRLHLQDDDGVVRTSDLGPGDHRWVPAGRIHRFEAIERCELVEVSTPELDDVERLEDDYGREGTNAP